MRPVARMPAIPPNETAAVPPASLRTLRRLVLTITVLPGLPSRWTASFVRHHRLPAAAGASRSAGLFAANAGQIFASWLSERLRIEREQLLGLADAAQGEAADRYQPRALGVRQAVGEGRGDQHRPVNRSTHRGDTAGLVDRWSNDGEVEPVDTADIAVKYLADMQPDINRGDRPFLGVTLLVQLLHALAHELFGLQR